MKIRQNEDIIRINGHGQAWSEIPNWSEISSYLRKLEHLEARDIYWDVDNVEHRDCRLEELQVDIFLSLLNFEFTTKTYNLWHNEKKWDLKNKFVIQNSDFLQQRSYGVMVSTSDSESGDPSSSLGRTWQPFFLF